MGDSGSYTSAMGDSGESREARPPNIPRNWSGEECGEECCGEECGVYCEFLNARGNIGPRRGANTSAYGSRTPCDDDTAEGRCDDAEGRDSGENGEECEFSGENGEECE